LSNGEKAQWDSRLQFQATEELLKPSSNPAPLDRMGGASLGIIAVDYFLSW
jgi:hypothetical protein